MGPEIKDEIPGLMDFYAASVVSGAISAAGFPESRDQWEEFAEVIAEFSYVQARALYAEKYKTTTKH